MTTIPRGLGLKQVLVLRSLASFDHSDPKRYWPLSVINERALKLSPNPRVTNSSRALAGLRRRGLVKGYYGPLPAHLGRREDDCQSTPAVASG